MSPSDSAPERDTSSIQDSAFAQAEKLATEYFGSVTVGVCIVDQELRFVAINDALAKINGIPASAHLGKTVREVLGELADSLEPEYRKVLATGIAANFEIRGRLPRRTEAGHWIGHYVPIPDENGRITRVGAVVVEVTAEKDLQLSLHETNKKLDNEVKRLETVLEISRLLSSNWDLPRLFPKISAHIRRVLHQEYASFALHDSSTGLLVRQAMDFPLGKGFTSKLPVAAGDSPSAHALEARVTKIFSKEEIQSFEGELARSFLAEGLQSLCCVPLFRPSGTVGVFVLGSTRKHAFKNEDLNLLEQVASQLAVAIENHRAAAEIEALKQRLGEERKYLEGESHNEGEFSEIVGESPALKRVLDQVATVAASQATVLILGETGTGKELIARAIHKLSRRKDGPFIKVNCAAIPTGLLESELFGHEKGAFTGAVSQKVGRMELADGGTMFLDEVGEIPLELQPKLLRVLQDQEFERLGSNRTIKVNLRLLAATNRNLAESIAQKQFRSDLFYRLSVFPIVLPPLRDRREDIPLLVRHFVRKFARRMDRYIEIIPPETADALRQWHWPGNVRELENMIERSVILSEGNSLRVPLSELREVNPSGNDPTDHTLDNAERQHIIRVLRGTHAVLSGPDGAARRLGLKRSTLQSKMHRLKITREDYSDPHQ
jgi:formate hydrogenlyase transcriptional activator